MHLFFFPLFISLSKGNAFIDAIIEGTDEMIKMEINCCFEQRHQSSGTQQAWCGKKEVCRSAVSEREFKEERKRNV